MDGKFAFTDGHTPAELIDTINQITQTLSVEDAWAIHCNAMARYGFDKLLYGFTRFNTGKDVGHNDDLLLLSSMPDGYIKGFIDGELFKIAPMTRWARENVGSISWRWLTENRDSFNCQEREVLAFNQSFGVAVGYTIAFQDAHTRHKGAIALVAQPGMTQDEIDDLWRYKNKEINALNQVAHLKFTALPLPRSRARLSRRQREVLEWVGDGKTMQDIATILGLTQTTVEKHLRNAREALGVDTTAQAVRKASVQNQIFVIES